MEAYLTTTVVSKANEQPKMPLVGVIIKESLTNGSVLDALVAERCVTVTSTKVEPVTAKHQTPWIQQWTLCTVEVSAESAEDVANKLAVSLHPVHPWYADFKDNKTHYIIFFDRVFVINRTSKEEYDAASAYGVSLGIPAYQVDFHPDVAVWERDDKK